MRYGFLIDHKKCIGCHACTVACKEENGVPLGAFRTWVKYIEKGVFPDTRRYFSVLRCNHCDDAPCTTICPTTALFRRKDGIVDFDPERCIGCKSCMQACPYDALHIDPHTNTAAKCNYCAHRVEMNLEPACVVVCPEQAIVAGDLDNPASHIAKRVGTEQTQVRKPEQGTRPKVFYVGADQASLTPQALERGESYLFAETGMSVFPKPAAPDEGLARDLQTMARTVYDVPHLENPWGWKVSAYLWTKSVAAGVLGIAAASVAILGWKPGTLLGIWAPFLALVFLGLTTVLLVADLKRPDRFHYILLKPNWRSWLVWGAWILMGFGGVATAWLAAGFLGRTEWFEPLAWPAVVLSVAAACYSAFLFGQAEGRDFWQSPLLFWQLLASAAVAGSAALLLAMAAAGFEWETLQYFGFLLSTALAVQGGVLAIEVFGKHPSQDAAKAAATLRDGHLSGLFWGGAVGLGVAAPLVSLALVGGGIGAVGAAVSALVGLYLYEEAWVRAGQAVPLS